MKRYFYPLIFGLFFGINCLNGAEVSSEFNKQVIKLQFKLFKLYKKKKVNEFKTEFNNLLSLKDNIDLKQFITNFKKKIKYHIDAKSLNIQESRKLLMHFLNEKLDSLYTNEERIIQHIYNAYNSDDVDTFKTELDNLRQCEEFNFKKFYRDLLSNAVIANVTAPRSSRCYIMLIDLEFKINSTT